MSLSLHTTLAFWLNLGLVQGAHTFWPNIIPIKSCQTISNLKTSHERLSERFYNFVFYFYSRKSEMETRRIESCWREDETQLWSVQSNNSFSWELVQHVPEQKKNNSFSWKIEMVTYNSCIFKQGQRFWKYQMQKFFVPQKAGHNNVSISSVPSWPTNFQLSVVANDFLVISSLSNYSLSKGYI
jgi:hypothetical protein